jgi:hypothetical protein
MRRLSEIFRRGYDAARDGSRGEEADMSAAWRAPEDPHPSSYPDEFYWKQGIPARPHPAQTTQHPGVVGQRFDHWRDYGGGFAGSAGSAGGGYEDELAECREVIAELLQRVREREEEIARLSDAARRQALAEEQRSGELQRACVARDRYQASGKRLLAQYRELEFILRFPGVEKALQKQLHPDMHPGANAGEQRARSDIFTKLIVVYERMKRSAP